MSNNNAKVAVVYRTLPGDSGSALVVGTNQLPDAYLPGPLKANYFGGINFKYNF